MGLEASRKRASFFWVGGDLLYTCVRAPMCVRVCAPARVRVRACLRVCDRARACMRVQGFAGA